MTTLQNPFILQTRHATGVFGRLVRTWAIDEGARKKLAGKSKLPRSGRLVVKVKRFRKALSDAGLREGTEKKPADFCIRDGVEEVQLIVRKPECFTILLPERRILRELGKARPPITVRVANLYLDVAKAGSDLDYANLPRAEGDHGAATYDLRLGADPFGTFLDPFMASYICSQCR